MGNEWASHYFQLKDSEGQLKKEELRIFKKGKSEQSKAMQVDTYYRNTWNWRYNSVRREQVCLEDGLSAFFKRGEVRIVVRSVITHWWLFLSVTCVYVFFPRQRRLVGLLSSHCKNYHVWLLLRYGILQFLQQ